MSFMNVTLPELQNLPNKKVLPLNLYNYLFKYKMEFSFMSNQGE